MVRAYLALGSNLGNRGAALEFARRRLASLPNTILRASSAVEETAPLGGLDQPMYLNQMLALDTTLGPEAFLAACHQIEADAGRTRRDRWESRILDLDLVSYGALEIRSDAVVLPHPGLSTRDFWQRQLNQLGRMGW